MINFQPSMCFAIYLKHGKFAAG